MPAPKKPSPEKSSPESGYLSEPWRNHPHLRTTHNRGPAARLLTTLTAAVLALGGCSQPTPQARPPMVETRSVTRAPATAPATAQRPAEVTATSTFTECPQVEAAAGAAALRLVYQREGDLWLQADTGSPRLILEGAQADSLLLSPDGSLVTFSRLAASGGSELAAVDAIDGTVNRLSGDTKVPGAVEMISFSDDGQWIAFSVGVDFGRELWVANLDGSGARVLASTADLQSALNAGPEATTVAVNVGWIPGTHLLTYVPIVRGSGDAIQFYEPVYLANADTGVSELLLPVGEGGYLSYAPDGQVMVIADPWRIQLMPADLSDAPRTVLEYPVADLGLEGYIPAAVWLADATSFLVATPSESTTVEHFFHTGTGPMTVWSVTRDGEAQILSEYQDAPLIFAFSPDAARLAYYQQNEQVDLHITRADGAEDWLVASGEEHGFLAWAPGSQRFAYRAAGELRIGDLCRESVPGPDSPEIEFLRWLDDSRYLVLRGLWGAWGLHIMTIQGDDVPLYEFGPSDLWTYVVIGP